MSERTNEMNTALLGACIRGIMNIGGLWGREGKGRVGLMFRPTIRVVLQIYRQKHNGRVVSQ